MGDLANAAAVLESDIDILGKDLTNAEHRLGEMGNRLDGAVAGIVEAVELMRNLEGRVAGRLAALEARLAALEPTPPPVPEPGWALAWSDEFDGPGLDLAVWTPGENSWGGQLSGMEYQAWKAENAVVEGGMLRLTAKREAHLGRQYSGGIVHTKGKKDFIAPARFEVRMKYPTGNGFWPGVWLLHDTHRLANTFEIDFCEVMTNKPDDTYHGYHYYPADFVHHETDRIWRRQAVGFSAEWHTYAIEWLPTSIEWFIDGLVVQRIAADEDEPIIIHEAGNVRTAATARPLICDRPMHLILDLSLGGWNNNKPDATTPLPSSLEIEYVKVFTWRA